MSARQPGPYCKVVKKNGIYIVWRGRKLVARIRNIKKVLSTYPNYELHGEAHEDALLADGFKRHPKFKNVFSIDYSKKGRA